MALLAQFVTNVLAFLLLLVILKKFAWGTLLKLVDERKEKIAAEFRTIDQAKEELAKLKVEYQQHLRKIEEEARGKIQQAVSEGRRIGMEIEEDARAHARATLEKVKETAAMEVAKARSELKEQVVDLAIQITHKVLQQHLDEETDRRMIEGFIQEVNALEKGSDPFSGKGV